MTLGDAAKKGIARVRLPIWANKNAYMKIDLVGGGRLGPWGKLYERGTQEAIGEPTPQILSVIGDTSDGYEEYTGELDADDKHIKRFNYLPA